jgi:hypothetical protein
MYVHNPSICVALSIMPAIGLGRSSCLTGMYSLVLESLRLIGVYPHRLPLLTACSANADPYCVCLAEQAAQVRRSRAPHSELYVESPPMVHAVMFDVAMLDLSKPSGCQSH